MGPSLRSLTHPTGCDKGFDVPSTVGWAELAMPMLNERQMGPSLRSLTPSYRFASKDFNVHFASSEQC